MKCYDAVCKYKEDEKCSRDNLPCDMKQIESSPVTMFTCHCEKDSNFILSCYKACLYYNSCTRA